MSSKKQSRNRTIGLMLLVWVLAIFAWTLYRGSDVLGSMLVK